MDRILVSERASAAPVVRPPLVVLVLGFLACARRRRSSW